MMKAARIVKYKEPLEIQDIPIPKPEGRDILVKVYSASFCHTDLVIWEGVQLHGGNTPPITASHEAVGIIEALGPDVDPKFKIGDRVGALNYYHPCGRCKDCKANDEGYVYCQKDQKTLGLTMDGGFAEYMLTDSIATFKLPDNLSMNDAAPLMCAGVTMYKALKRCNLKKGETVGVIGCGGGLGHIGIQLAKNMGYNVVGVDAQDEALRIAKSINCLDVLIDVRKTNKEQAVKEIAARLPTEISEDQGCGAVIVLPSSQPAFDYACKITHKHGIVMTVSVPSQKWQVSSQDLIFKNLSIKGSLYCSTKDAEEMLLELAQNPVHVEKRIFKLEQVNEAIEASQRGGKIVIELLKE